MRENPRPNGIIFVDDDRVPETHPVKRWSYPIRLYASALSMVPKLKDSENGDGHARLSWLMDKYWRERGSPNSMLTLRGLGGIYKILTNRYPALNQPGEVLLGKQQPSLVESTGATLKRLDFLYRYVKKLTDPYVSVVSGGSMSYGRFYNVREGADPSDLDLIFVFRDGEEANMRAETILPPALGFKRDDVLFLQERMGIFAYLLSERKADVLSHKVLVKPFGFSISMHIMPSYVFEDMMVYNPRSDSMAGCEVDRRVRDYKPEPFKYRAIRLNTFNGEPLLFSVEEEPIHGGVTDCEVITQIPAHAIVKGRFVPGLYHNLLSPRFEMEAFSARECVASATLFWSLMRRLEREYRKTDPNASALKSHIRYELFNPMMIKEHDK